MKKFSLVMLVLSLIVIASISYSVSAKEVAYLYDRSSKIDNNFVNFFEGRGYEVDFIQQNSIPTTNFSSYSFLFINDEVFSNPSSLPITKYPSLFANYYHGDELGITDSDSVSKIASSQPLRARYNNQIVQIYTQGSVRGIGIEAYHLFENNVAPAFEPIAETYLISSGTGYYVAKADAGSKLLNGKTLSKNICFYGIIRSDYWTSSSKEMLGECIDSIVEEPVVCYRDLDCGEDSTSEPFCSEDDLYEGTIDYTCMNPGLPTSFCKVEENDRFIESCSYQCSNGECIEEPPIACHTNLDCGQDSVSSPYCSIKDILTNSTSYTCNNPGEYSSFCSVNNSINLLESCSYQCSNAECIEAPLPFCGDNIINNNEQCDDGNTNNNDGCSSSCQLETISCNSNLDCGNNTLSQPFCSNNDVKQNSTIYTCNNPGQYSSFCSSSSSSSIVESCSYMCANGECIEEPPVIECYQNSDCGNNTISQPFCSVNNIITNSTSFICNNPGLPSSSCTINKSQTILESCSYQCSNAECISPPPVRCDEDLDCNDSNPLTYDQCINPGLPISTCRNTPINCASNLDCGTSGFIGTEYCSLDSVSKNYQNATCINPGLPSSFCTLEVTQTEVLMCEYACSEASCIRCDENLDCNDNDSSTIDICKNPSTIQSYCSNQKPVQNITCYTNLDCGTSGFSSEPFCSVNNISRQFTQYTCNNPGLSNSFCTNQISNKTIESCSYQCSNAECIEAPLPFCGDNIINNNEQCDDGNTNNNDGCSSSCQLETISCNSNLDCGNNTLSQPFCSNNDVKQNSTIYTCNNPGEYSSFCSSSSSSSIVESCSYQCANGQCIEEPPVIECYQNSDCGNNTISQPFCSVNNITQTSTMYTCNNPGTSQSSCAVLISNQTLQSCSYQCQEGQCIEEPPIACHTNLDCGQDSVSSPYCSIKDILTNSTSYTCNNPGEYSSFCSVNNSINLLESCSYQCSNAECIEAPLPFCGDNIINNNEQCDDGNTNNNDGCSSSCQLEENECKLACTQDSDCGTNSLSEPYCFLNNLQKTSIIYTCHNPNQFNAYCSSSTIHEVIDLCENQCQNGLCI